ncbi:MAG: DUF86 domain-containing protein [Chloroflexi bacterium]|nr:DUF86 domain-containing protein [Chloroflexota bacterium]
MIDPDIVYAKVGTIHRCLERIRQVTQLEPNRLDDIDVQDIFVLNLQRAIQAAIDLAAHVIAAEGLGLPTTLRENFTLLQRANILSPGISSQMTSMVGFRNLAVHGYEVLDVEVLKSILQHHLSDLEAYSRAILTHCRL